MNDQPLRDAPVRLPFVREGKGGYLDERGEVVIAPRFDRALPFEDGLAPVCVGRAWGYIDASGEFAITPRFEGASAFSEGRARVQIVESERGIEMGVRGVFVDREGRHVCDCDATDGDFHEGLARLTRGSKVRYVRLDGTEAFALEAAHARSFAGGRAAIAIAARRVPTRFESDGSAFMHEVVLPGPFGFLDRDGRLAVDPAFDEVSDFAEGVAAVRRGATWVERPYEYRQGDRVLTATVQRTLSGGEWFFVDAEGSVVLEGGFRYADRFSEGLARVAVGGEWGDEPYEKDGVRTVLHRLSGTSWGFLDREGRFAIAPRIAYHVERFVEGRARFFVDGRWGFLDREGRERIAPTFTQADDFRGGFAKVTRDETWGYVDRDGAWLWHT